MDSDGDLDLAVASDTAFSEVPNCALPCYCNCHGDTKCDGATNIQDVVATIGIAFRGIPPESTTNCFWENSDVDCSGITDILDVVRIINVAFRGGDPATLFCDPCQ